MQQVLNNKSYTELYEKSLRDHALSVYKENPKNGKIARLVEQIYAREHRFEEMNTRDEKHQAMVDVYSDFQENFDTLSQEEQVELLRVYGKLNDLGRTARKTAATHEVNHTHKHAEEAGGKSADKLLFTLKTLEKQSPAVSKEYVQHLLDTMVVEFSLTSHPTNASDLEHTQRGIEIETILANPEATPADLGDALKDYMKAPLATRKKTQQEEAQEALEIIKNIWDSAPRVRENLESALKQTRFWKEGVRVKAPFVKPHLWCAGDGDGNENSTEETLEKQFDMLRNLRKDLVLKDLLEIEKQSAASSPELSEYVEWLQKEDSLPQEEELLEKINLFEKQLENKAGAAEAITSLRKNIEMFGEQLALTDIRHDAKSINKTLDLLLDAHRNELGGILQDNGASHSFCDYKMASPDKRAVILTQWLENDDVMAFLSKISAEQIKKDDASPEDFADVDAANRILKRLHLVAEHPEMSDQLIIAEAQGNNDVLAAMMLLKATGHEVGNEKARMHIVPLLESIPDLENLEGNIRKLSENSLFSKHIAHLGEWRIMLAESDNRRRGGLGAGEKIYSTLGSVIAMKHDVEERIRLNHGDLADNFKGLRVFNGGGADLVRGAQTKSTELAVLHGYEAKRANASTLLAPLCTIQGHQCRVLFSPPENADYLLEAMVSQGVYAKAGTEGKIARYNDGEKAKQSEQLQTQARAAAKDLHMHARVAYKKYWDNPSIDNALKVAGAWLTSKHANKSSRPNVRGQADAAGDDITIGDFIGTREKDTQVREQRAIGGSSMMRLSGCFPMPMLGQKEGLEAMLAKEEEQEMAPDNIYQNSRPERNHLRALASVLHQYSNFSKMWQTADMERPTTEELKAIAQNFDITKENDTLTTLCFLEQYASDTARLAYIAMKGKDPLEMQEYNNGKEFTPKDLLRDTWPELARSMERTQSNLLFGDAIESKINRFANQNPDEPLSSVSALAHNVVASTTLRNTPVGMVGIRTREIANDNQRVASEKDEVAESVGVLKRLSAKDIPSVLQGQQHARA